MKKFMKSAAILSLGFGLAMTFTACHNSDGESAPSGIEYTTANGLPQVSKTLIVNTNVNATIKYGSQSSANVKTYTFTGVSDKQTLTVSAPGYVTETFVVNFLDEDTKELNVYLHKPASGSAVAQAIGQELTVTNESGEVYNATMTVPAQTAFLGDGSPWSIIVFTPQATNSPVLAKGATVSEPVVAISCTPENVTFTDPVTVKLNIPKTEGLKLDVKNGNESLNPANIKRDADNLTLLIPHFSEWDIILGATVTNITDEPVEVFKDTREVGNGRVRVSYQRQVGYTMQGEEIPLVTKYLNKMFTGTAHPISATYSFNPPIAGTATIVLSQSKKTVTFESGEKTFVATIYGAVSPKVTIVPNGQPVQPDHSGGSSL
ncbi:MAG: hypothetical protein IJ841_04285 [Prevotella sp.]|nr:hypothetical protein [Prevotella sp.]